jgi:hypothetical protein
MLPFDTPFLPIRVRFFCVGVLECSHMTPEPTRDGTPRVPTELYETLESLDDLADEPFQPWGTGRALAINREEFFALTARVREQLPASITRAESLSEQAREIKEEARERAEAVVAEAQKESERVLDRARQKVLDLVENSPEVQFANAQRRDIISQAQKAADNARKDADDYSREVMERLEQHIKKVQQQVRNGLEALRLEQEMTSPRKPEPVRKPPEPAGRR